MAEHRLPPWRVDGSLPVTYVDLTVWFHPYDSRGLAEFRVVHEDEGDEPQVDLFDRVELGPFSHTSEIDRLVTLLEQVVADRLGLPRG